MLFQNCRLTSRSALVSPTHPPFFCLSHSASSCPFHASFFLGSLCISPSSCLSVKCRLFFLLRTLLQSGILIKGMVWLLVVHLSGSFISTGLSSCPVGIGMIRDSATHCLCTSKSISQDLELTKIKVSGDPKCTPVHPLPKY